MTDTGIEAHVLASRTGFRSICMYIQFLLEQAKIWETIGEMETLMGCQSSHSPACKKHIGLKIVMHGGELGIANVTVCTPSSASETLEKNLEDKMVIGRVYTSKWTIYFSTEA